MSSDLEFTVPTLEFSPLRVSTITTTAQLGTKINLEEIFNQIKILPYWDLNDGILKMEYKGQTKGTCFKDIMLKPKTTKTSFFNQATIIVRREVSPLNWKEINVKIFRNGGVQMTGIRSIEMSSDTIRWLLEHLLSTCRGEPIFTSTPNIHKEQTQLINTDFSIAAKVRRDILHKILSDTYGLNSSYESAIYQGVKTKYFYNAQRPADKPPGRCPCERLCKGTGDGSKIGECKKITISPFQTGNGIITGARDMAQINEAYEFIKEVFTTHADTVLRKIYVLPTKAAGEPEVTAPKTKTKAKSNAWIQHPCPRNIIKITNMPAI
jgi:TATA-box binding protein (TBP) (component of TFIID and TFIIIB)